MNMLMKYIFPFVLWYIFSSGSALNLLLHFKSETVVLSIWIYEINFTRFSWTCVPKIVTSVRKMASSSDCCVKEIKPGRCGSLMVCGGISDTDKTDLTPMEDHINAEQYI